VHFTDEERSIGRLGDNPKVMVTQVMSESGIESHSVVPEASISSRRVAGISLNSLPDKAHSLQ
jgi:hypothetical protein